MIHTIRLASISDVLGNTRAITPVYYGTAKPVGIAPGTNMLIMYNTERGTAFLYGQPYGHHSGDIACRILHGDVLAIGDNQFQVHCPEDWPKRPPELHRIDGESGGAA
ncbi:hypothetical protein [Nocardia sp. NPDC057455]|uniref:hypothetical protein n=1 Tax=Nocardia sp. NPDC057455 TaxID=3346138 RepID=UPI00366BED8B